MGVWAQGAAIEIPVEQLIQEASGLLQGGSPGEAAVLFERIARQSQRGPIQEAALYNLGAARFQAKDYSGAIEAFRRFVGDYPTAATVNDARMALGLALAITERYAEAIPEFRAVEAVPSLRIQALNYRAEAALRAGEAEGAIEAYEAVLGSGARDFLVADAVFGLIPLYGEKRDFERAQRALDFLQQNLGLVDNLIRLNALALDLGDRLQAAGDAAGALEAYRVARRRKELLAGQKVRNGQIEARIAALERTGSGTAQVADLVTRLKARMEDTAKLAADLEGAPDYDADIHYRVARAFHELDKPWEAGLLFEEVVEKFPGYRNRELAMFGLMRCLFDTGRGTAARAVGDRFQAEYAASPYADRVAFIAGQLAFAAQDFTAAGELFAAAVDRYTASELREEMIVLMANAQFLKGDHGAARAAFERYVQDFPEGRFREDAVYRNAMTAFFAADYAAAEPALRAYAEQYPEGKFAADAAFRLAVCSFAARNFERTLDQCAAWLAANPGHALEGDLHSLAGDAHKALGREDAALEAFRTAARVTGSDDVRGYAMMEMTRLWQGRGDYTSIAEMYEQFVRENPEDPLVPSAMYWIGRARAREGKVSEAQAFLAETVTKTIGDPGQDAVEPLITQLAQLVSRRPRPAPGAPRPPPQTLSELAGRMDLLLTDAAQVEGNTAKARLLFARAELARLNKLVADEERVVSSIADVFHPDELSPALLGRVGRRLLDQGQAGRAEPFFERLVTAYPRSEWADAGFVGLGEIAMRRSDFAAALRFFTDAIEKAGAVHQAREATLGQARALLEIGRAEGAESPSLERARRLFEQVAATREWRGEATAQSVFHLGEIARMRGDLPAAVAYFQRVYVGYQRFLPWVARAYLESGKVFEQLARDAEAGSTYREMLQNEKLTEYAEYQEARERLTMVEARAGGGA